MYSESAAEHPFEIAAEARSGLWGVGFRRAVFLHPVSITRFPLSRFSPRAGLLRNPFVCTINAKTFQGLGPKRRESCNGDRV